MKNYRIFIAFLCALLINACSPSKPYDAHKVFRMNIHAGLTSLDPAFASNQANIWVSKQIFNSLLELDDEMNPVPSAAHSWDVSDDGLTYTFYLNSNIYFHDHPAFEGGKGRKVTANDFVYSFNRIIDPSVASPGAWIFNDKVRIDSSDNNKARGSFYADNDTTFRIELLNPFPPLLGLLTMQYCSVVPKEVVNKYGRDFRTNPVGSGPFQFFLWEENNKIILHRNPNYFEKDENGKQLPYLEAVDISLLSSKQNEFFSFIRQELDFMSGLDPSFRDNLLTADGRLTPRYEGGFVMEKLPFLNTEYLGILMDTLNESLKGSPLKQQKIRQAINYGIDRKRMIRYLRNNIGQPGHSGFVPKGMSSFNPERVKGYEYNPNKVNSLLRKAGFPDGKGLPEITIYTNESYLDIAVFMQSQLAEFGIPIHIDVNPSSIHREWIFQSRINFFRGSWIADYPDAENYLALFYSGNLAPSGPNYTHFNDPVYDSLYESSQLITDDSARYEVYYQMENLMMEQSPVVVLYYDEVVRLIQNNVRGLNRNAINLICLKNVYKEKETERLN